MQLLLSCSAVVGSFAVYFQLFRWLRTPLLSHPLSWVEAINLIGFSSARIQLSTLQFPSASWFAKYPACFWDLRSRVSVNCHSSKDQVFDSFSLYSDLSSCCPFINAFGSRFWPGVRNTLAWAGWSWSRGVCVPEKRSACTHWAPSPSPAAHSASSLLASSSLRETSQECRQTGSWRE